MNNIVAQQKASSFQDKQMAGCLLELCHHLDLIPIPLKPKSKVPLVKWSDESWKPSPVEIEAWASKPGLNWGVRCGEKLAVIDCDSEDAYFSFITTHELPPDCPIVKTGRGYHIWVKPKMPIRSQRVGGIEIKCRGSYIVAPPSIHPSGASYVFEVPPNGVLPEVDLEALFNLPSDSNGVSGKSPTKLNAPSDFALRYGKSQYPQSLCGLATKIMTKPDGQVKKLLSLRCWKWHCPKCAPLMKSHWLEKLSALSFRFILKLRTMDKPTSFLRHLGKPAYVHILANGESWLFLTAGEAERVWAEVRKADYELIVGDISGAPTPQEVRECLEQALCREEDPLNTSRKITHSRGLFTKTLKNNEDNESKRKDDCAERGENMNENPHGKPTNWKSKVVLKPIREVAEELEEQGWEIIWKSEVEALAVKKEAVGTGTVDIIDLIENLGVKLKKVGKEYVGLCPFHDDHSPSLSVNRKRGLWHCFGCGRGGDSQRFFEEWQQR